MEETEEYPLIQDSKATKIEGSFVQMRRNIFRSQKIDHNNSKWATCTKRKDDLYHRTNDVRTEFSRDFNRILHSTAYRRLKHKTQVFPAPNNDHICTRMEHVNLVASISYTIAKHLGLNTELTQAIAIGHDLGHPPFGHEGEEILNKLSKKNLNTQFHHEKNSLRFVDNIETLEDPQGNHRNLNLTYAVRDGIICHCGEVDENGLKPRDEYLDLNQVQSPADFQPYTWEGCVVKISDKIAYLGRDIEDAITLKILDRSQLRQLGKLIRKYSNIKIKEINNTIVIHELIINLCKKSNPSNGLIFSDKYFEIMSSIKKFNYTNIYSHKRLGIYKKYSKVVMESIFSTLEELYEKDRTIENILSYLDFFPLLMRFFLEWTIKYSIDSDKTDIRRLKYMNIIRDVNHWQKIYRNKKIYSLRNKQSFLQSIIDFMAGMTDNFAIKIFEELTSF